MPLFIRFRYLTYLRRKRNRINKQKTISNTLLLGQTQRSSTAESVNLLATGRQNLVST